jgi:hypothetical protein
MCFPLDLFFAIFNKAWPRGIHILLLFIYSDDNAQTDIEEGGIRDFGR